jgi:hypothetical protein
MTEIYGNVYEIHTKWCWTNNVRSVATLYYIHISRAQLMQQGAQIKYYDMFDIRLQVLIEIFVKTF